MKITFKIQASELDRVLSTVSVVPPQVVTPKGGKGYLFSVREGQCYVYSRDGVHMSRANAAVDVSGDVANDVSEDVTEGSFIYPSDYVKGFKFLGDEEITVTATNEDGFSVGYTTGSHASVTHSSVDPKLFSPIDKDLEGAGDEREYPAAVLLEAMKMAKVFAVDLLDPANTKEENGTIQIFDATMEEYKAGNGSLYTTNGHSAMFFFTEAFRDKGLSIHPTTLSGVMGFFSSCDTSVKMKTSASSTFAINEKGWVYGWAHQAKPVKSYAKYGYYALTMDKYLMIAPVSVIQNALRYLASEMDKTSVKIKVEYASASKSLVFKSADGRVISFPVPVDLQEESENKDLSFYVNIEHFKALFDGAKGREIQVRIFPYEEASKSGGGKKLKILMRTIDEFILDNKGKLVGGSGGDQVKDTHKCVVTRFLVSMA